MFSFSFQQPACFKIQQNCKNVCFFVYSLSHCNFLFFLNTGWGYPPPCLLLQICWGCAVFQRICIQFSTEKCRCFVQSQCHLQVHPNGQKQKTKPREMVHIPTSELCSLFAIEVSFGGEKTFSEGIPPLQLSVGKSPKAVSHPLVRFSLWFIQTKSHNKKNVSLWKHSRID